MPRLSSLIRPVIPLACTLFSLLHDVSRFLCLCLRPSPALAAENLFLRKQLALYQEHHVTPGRVTHATRVVLVWLSQWFNWPSALVVVNRQHFSGGGAKGATCSGATHHVLADHRSRWTCKGSSGRWRATI